MKKQSLHLILALISWAVFTVMGRLSAQSISQGFAPTSEYLFFLFALAMFVVTWVLVFKEVHHLADNWK
ncbi:MAG: hypothetical protein ACKOC5_04985 [Chloroflexota bacterium]